MALNCECGFETDDLTAYREHLFSCSQSSWCESKPNRDDEYRYMVLRYKPTYPLPTWLRPLCV